MSTDKLHDTKCSQDSDPLLRRGYDAHESVTCKQRTFDQLAAIAPPVNLTDHGTEHVDPLNVELSLHHFFVSRPCPYGVPVQFYRDSRRGCW
ncbi:hypothetical protein SBA1_500041 [Candidatus Sulfotelmatobacter kueseliae]|uniref:Uncharacterized protein n=1 Tax=Candidatus Sulfotelmatobacter kueseliae TaxID=2042962 RepID=A0A2U3KWD4_9BACT|nr:hypothetical protein SBA1_500041 [Candidatus Sulfotelmatobacter kueseliae]